jgi:hypothetical protein
MFLSLHGSPLANHRYTSGSSPQLSAKVIHSLSIVEKYAWIGGRKKSRGFGQARMVRRTTFRTWSSPCAGFLHMRNAYLSSGWDRGSLWTWPVVSAIYWGSLDILTSFCSAFRVPCVKNLQFFFATCANENVISDVVLLGRKFMGWRFSLMSFVLEPKRSVTVSQKYHQLEFIFLFLWSALPHLGEHAKPTSEIMWRAPVHFGIHVVLPNDISGNIALSLASIAN